MHNRIVKTYKANLKDKELEQIIAKFLNELSGYDGVTVSIMISGNIQNLIKERIQKSEFATMHFYSVNFDADLENRVTFHQYI